MFDQENELIKEFSVLLCETMRQIDLQVDSLRDLKKRLEMEWSKKKEAYDIDTINMGLNFKLPNIMSHPTVIAHSERYVLHVVLRTMTIFNNY